jgi:hypothetical protein
VRTSCTARARGAAGKLVTAAIRDMHVEIPLVAGRAEATGVRTGTRSPPTRAENRTCPRQAASHQDAASREPGLSQAPGR